MSGSSFDASNPAHWRQLATHESGHAVMAVTWGFPLESVTIANGNGLTSTAPAITFADVWSRLMIILAGEAAEELAGFEFWDSGSDVDNKNAATALRLLGLGDSDLVLCRSLVRAVLAARRAQIDAVAAALLERKILTGADVAEIFEGVS